MWQPRLHSLKDAENWSFERTLGSFVEERLPDAVDAADAGVADVAAMYACATVQQKFGLANVNVGLVAFSIEAQPMSDGAVREAFDSCTDSWTGRMWQIANRAEV